MFSRIGFNAWFQYSSIHFNVQTIHVFFWPFQSVSIFNLIFQVNVLGLCGRARMNVCRDSDKQSVWWCQHMNIQRCSVSLRAQQHSEHSFYVFHYNFRRILSILCAKRLLFIHFRLFRFFFSLSNYLGAAVIYDVLYSLTFTWQNGKLRWKKL